MADPTPTPTSPFSVGASLTPGAGEQKITREKAAEILAATLRATDAAGKPQEEGGFLNGIAKIGRGVTELPNVSQVVTKALANKIVGGDAPKDEYDNLAAKLVDLLPEDALYESVLGRIDRRQIYAQVMTAGKTKQSKTIGSTKFSPDERALAGKLFGVEQDQALTAGAGLATAKGVVGDAEVKAYAAESANAYHAQGTTLGVSPTAAVTNEITDPTAPDSAPAGGADQSFADMLANGAGAAGGKTPFLTSADVQALFRLSSSDLGATNAYINQLADYRGNVDPNFVDPFKVTSGVDPFSTKPAPSFASGGGDMGDAANRARLAANYAANTNGSRGYSITEAKDLLYGMSKDEVAKMQNLLLRAGYFADANGKSTKPLFMGDPTDQTTQTGWLSLIGDAIRSGQPIFDTLSKRALDAGNKFSNVDGTIATDVALTDSAQIAQGADELGTKEIGRKLTDEEHAKVIEFIHGLEAKAQGTSNEPGAQTVENPDVQSEINKYLHDTFTTEADAKDVAGTYDEFTSMLAGPGGR